MTTKDVEEWLQGRVPISCDPLPTVMTFNKVLQLLHWPVEVVFREGESVFFSEILGIVVNPLLSRPFRHVLSRSMCLDMGETDSRISSQVCSEEEI